MSSKKKKVKKRRINKKKLILLVIILIIVVLGVCKGTSLIFHNHEGKTNEAKVKSYKEKNKQKSSIKNKRYKIVIDAGHGGSDKGTLSKDKKVSEKNITLQIALNVVEKLSKYKDIDVITTRKDDRYVSLDDRVKIANNNMSDALISIHINSESNSTSAKGLEVWYRGGDDDNSKKLATDLDSTILSYVDTKDRGVLKNNFEVIKFTKMPSALIECGFISNNEERSNLVKTKYQNDLAEGITQGILSFVDSQKNSGKK